MRTSTLLAVLACAALVGVASAVDQQGVIRLTSIKLTSHGTIADGVLDDHYLLETNGLTDASMPEAATVNWMGMVGTAKASFCFIRAASDSGVGASFPLSPTGANSVGSIQITVSYLGDSANLVGNGVLAWANGEATEKCVETTGFISYEDSETAASNCISPMDDFVLNGAAANTITWTLDSASDCVTDCNDSGVLLDATPMFDLTIQAETFAATVEFVNPITVAARDATIPNSLVPQPENIAIYRIEVERACPSTLLDDAGWTDVWPSYPDQTFKMVFDDNFMPTGFGIVCADTPVADVSYACTGTPIGMETAPDAVASDWLTDTSGFSSMGYVEANGWPVTFTGTECGAQSRKVFRLKMFNADAVANFQKFGKLELTQTSPTTTCQPTIGGSARSDLQFHVTDANADPFRADDTATLTGDTRTWVSALSYAADSGKYSATIGARLYTKEQFDTTGTFQRFLTVVGMGTCYGPDSGNAYTFANLADTPFDIVCTNIPETYAATAPNWISSTPVGSSAIHDFLFGGTPSDARFPTTLEITDAIGGGGTISSVSGYADSGAWDLVPIREVGDNVLGADATLSEIYGESGNYRIDFKFEGTMNKIEKCVVPGSTTKQVIVSNGGDVEGDDPNYQYTWTMHHTTITYVNEVADEIWSSPSDTLCHEYGFTVTVNSRTGAMVTSQADAIGIIARLRQVRYAVCTGGCIEPAAAGINMPTGFSCGSSVDDDQRRQLELTLEILLEKAVLEGELGDLGIINHQSLFGNGENVNCYNEGVPILISVTNGQSNDDNLRDTATVNGLAYNRFVVVYRTSCIATIESGVQQVDAFASCNGNPTTFDIAITLHRVAQNETGTWADTYTSSDLGSRTYADGVITIQVDVPYRHTPVDLTSQTVAHSLALDIEIVRDPRIDHGCNSEYPCRSLSPVARNALSPFDHAGAIVRLDGNSITGANVGLHIREARICRIKTGSPYAACVSGSAVSTDCEGSGGAGGVGDDTDVPFSAGFAFGGSMGTQQLQDNCDKTRWQIWLESAAGANLNRAAATVANPIEYNTLLMKDYAPVQLINEATGSQVAGSVEACRADDPQKTLVRSSDHKAWACQAETECGWFTEFTQPPPENLNTNDGVAFAMTYLDTDKDLRMEVIAVAYECSVEMRRLHGREMTEDGGVVLHGMVSPNRGLRTVDAEEALKKAQGDSVLRGGRKLTASVVGGQDVASVQVSVTFGSSSNPEEVARANAESVDTADKAFAISTFTLVMSILGFHVVAFFLWCRWTKSGRAFYGKVRGCCCCCVMVRGCACCRSRYTHLPQKAQRNAL